MPSGYSQIVPKKSNLNYGYETQPESTTNERKLYWPRGRGWGGSSSINAMVYIRGHSYDYDLWRQMGNIGWSYVKMSFHTSRKLKIFKGTEIKTFMDLMAL